MYVCFVLSAKECSTSGDFSLPLIKLLTFLQQPRSMDADRAGPSSRARKKAAAAMSRPRQWPLEDDFSVRIQTVVVFACDSIVDSDLHHAPAD